MAANRAPKWKQNPVQLPAAPPGKDYEARLTTFVDDPDLIAGDHNFYQIVESPKWATLSFEGVFRGTPKDTDKGEHRWKIRVTDDEGFSAEATVIVEVKEVLCQAPATWHFDMLYNEATESDCRRLRDAVTRQVLDPIRQRGFSALILGNTCNGSGQYNIRVLPETDAASEPQLSSLMRTLNGTNTAGKIVSIHRVRYIETYRSLSLLKGDGIQLIHNTGYSPSERTCSALGLKEVFQRENVLVTNGSWTDFLALARQFFPTDKVAQLEAQQTSGNRREIFYGVNVVDETGNNGFVVNPKWDFP